MHLLARPWPWLGNLICTCILTRALVLCGFDSLQSNHVVTGGVPNVRPGACLSFCMLWW